MREKYDYKNICSQILSNLPLKQKKVIEARFGLMGGKKQTLQQIGSDFGVTRERIRQMEIEAFTKLKERDLSAVKNLSDVFSYFYNYLKDNSGLKREDVLLSDLCVKENNNYVLFILKINKDLFYVPEGDDSYAFWTIDLNLRDRAKSLEKQLVKIFEKEKKPLSFEEFLSRAKEEKRFLLNVIEISKLIDKGPLQDIGLAVWPEIHPRGVKDAAFLCLKKFGSPLHFRDIAILSNQLKGEYFNRREILPQTVHNELIKDPRFVLVGRGIYALKQWGYSQGTVRDIIKQVLSEFSNPMDKEEIVKLVLAKKLVKPNTILLNLRDSKFFKKNNNGKYTILES